VSRGAARPSVSEGAVMETVVLLVVSAGLVVYLLIALLSPERF
jgi:K+-transporting ATPase KdpF subunit